MYPILQLGSYRFYTFGLLFGCAVCLGLFTFERYFRRHGLLGRVQMPVLGTILVCCGLIGSKLDTAAAAILPATHLHSSFLQVFTDLGSGYTYLGSILFGWLGGAIYAYVRGIPTLEGYDSLFCLAPAYALGRIGCFLAGDGDYGIPSNLPWAVSFPHGVVPTTARVHPTMLYSSAWELAVFAVLWRLSNPRRQLPLRPGTLLGGYLIATGTGRFLVEFIGLNPVLAFGLTEAQLVSAAMILGGALVLGYVLLSRRTAAPVPGLSQHISSAAAPSA